MNAKLNKFFLVCFVTVGCALPGFTQNEPDKLVKMVTYFPVPYALYNNLYIKDKFDIGTHSGNEGFTLELGSSSSNVSLSADDVFLRQVNTSAPLSTLKMDTNFTTQTAIFGDTTTQTNNNPAAVHAKNLTVNSGLAPNNVTTGKINANTIDLFGKGALPACGYDESTHQGGAQWQQLTIGGKTGYYLVCCKEADDCVDCYYNNKETFAAACEASVEGATWCSKPDGSNTPCAVCGCSCPANSHQIENNTKCECDDTHRHPDGGGSSCVPRCQVDSYKTENKSECCSQPGVSYSDPICYVLRWGQVYSSNTCEDETNCSAEAIDGAACANQEGAQCKIVEKAGTCKTTYMACRPWPDGWQ